jgi:hypothetical protein
MRPEVVAATYDILVQRAQERNVVTYSDLSSMVPGLPVRGHAMINTLLAVGARSWEEKGVLLPVLVVNAGRTGLPSSGFYESLTQYRPNDDQSDLARAARRERERVYAAYPMRSP